MNLQPVSHTKSAKQRASLPTLSKSLNICLCVCIFTTYVYAINLKYIVSIDSTTLNEYCYISLLFSIRLCHMRFMGLRFSSSLKFMKGNGAIHLVAG